MITPWAPKKRAAGKRHGAGDIVDRRNLETFAPDMHEVAGAKQRTRRLLNGDSDGHVIRLANPRRGDDGGERISSRIPEPAENVGGVRRLIAPLLVTDQDDVDRLSLDHVVLSVQPSVESHTLPWLNRHSRPVCA
ncbi:MAG: hypothetical protein VX160_07630 [Actinomycetota bacterium]|nr:hypothetical protein [Actinomycetota bacterium]